MGLGLFVLDQPQIDCDLKTVAISAVHNALNVIAILLASLSVGGLLLVLLLLFGVERGSAAAQTTRRKD
jgi:hypothetical protein